MKKISVVIPTYNEEENVTDIYQRVNHVLDGLEHDYDREILFIDNYSTDRTRALLTSLCQKDKRVKAIFNAKNFGFTRSTYYGLTQATGNCAILLFADMQDPPEVIPEFVSCWEQGYKIVAGVKNKSKESRVMYLVRQCYYSLVKKISEVEQIEQFDGFGLYDQSFLQVLKELHDPLPYLRGIVSELGFQRKDVTYEQEQRKKGKTKFNFLKLYDLAMLGITSYSKVIMRLATVSGFFIAIISLIIAAITFVMKLIYWNSFPVGTAAISIGVFFFGSIQLFFIGFLGEYVLNINTRVMQRPLVIEEKRINFESVENEKEKTA
jgi:glycosyltransferase involved in cell wall biosynthesis